MKNVYAINYTLRGKLPQEDDAIAQAIQGASNGSYMRCIDGFWIIVSEHSEISIFDHIAKYMKRDDLLMVHEMSEHYKCSLPREKMEWVSRVLG